MRKEFIAIAAVIAVALAGYLVWQRTNEVAVIEASTPPAAAPQNAASAAPAAAPQNAESTPPAAAPQSVPAQTPSAAPQQ